VEFNPAAERTFGYRRDDVVGKEMATLIIPPSLRDRHRSALARYVETGEARLLGQRLEMNGMRSDGTEFPVEITITRIAVGEPPMFTGYVRDITESKRSEEERERLLELEQVARRAAQRSRDELEAILQGVADGVTAQGPDGRVIYANEAAVRVLGYPAAEALLGTPIDEVLDRFDLLDEDGEPFPPEQLPTRRALAGERPPEAVVRFRDRTTGDERWSVVKAAPIVDPEGAVLMVINIFEDITEHKRSENAQRFLSEASELLASSLDYDATLNRVARLAVPGIADWCVVDLLDDDGSIRRVALAHADPAKLALAEELADRYPEQPESPRGVAEVIRTGEPQLLPEISNSLLEESAQSPEHLELLRSLGLHSAILVPMTARGRTLGAITFVTGESRRSFAEEDLVLTRELARRAATAVDNARVYQERSYIARTLQESLLPPNLPQIPGVDVAARFRAAGEGAEVGGDFYDLFDMGKSGWAIVIGDVCGKGADAAAITALARYTLRAAAMQEEQPSRILALLNEALLTQRGDKQFCTVAYGRLETNSKPGALVELACGGHPLPLILHPDGKVEAAGVPGTLLGVVPDPDLQDQSVELGPGDSLVLYTDGVIEARTAAGMFGVEELSAVLESSVGLDAAGIAERIELAVLEVEDDPRDDIAILVLQLRQ
jgi:PAS domain S-box-containing protein